MSIDKTKVITPGVTAICLNVNLRKIFTPYFDELVEEICINMLSKAYTEDWTPEQLETESVRALSDSCRVACRNKVRESMLRILESRTPEQIAKLIKDQILEGAHE